jgi:hypothetical protein
MTSIPIVSNIWTIEAQTSRLSCVLGFRSHAKISEPNVDERAMAQFPRSVSVGMLSRSVATKVPSVPFVVYIGT